MKTLLLRFATVATLLAPLLNPLSAQGLFKIVEQDQTAEAVSGTSSTYLAAKNVPNSATEIVMAGEYTSSIEFPFATPSILSSINQSIFAGVLNFNFISGPNLFRWEVEALPDQVDKLEPINAAANSSAQFQDLAVTSRIRYHLIGIADNTTSLINDNTSTTFLATPGTPTEERGFLAAGNSGTFTAAYFVDSTMQPKALSTDPDLQILVIAGQTRNAAAPFDGADAELHQYTFPLPANGTPLTAPSTITDAELQDLTTSDVVVTTKDVTWIGGTKSGTGKLGGTTDVWLGEADFVADQIPTSIRAGSEGDDQLLKMERGPAGEVFVTFTVTGSSVSFGSLSYDLDTAPDPVAKLPATHAFLALIKSDGTPGWLSPLGISETVGTAANPPTMIPADLSIDEGGNALVTLNGSGDFRIEGLSRALSGASQVQTNGAGKVADFTPIPWLDQAEAGTSVSLENKLALGERTNKAAFASVESDVGAQLDNQMSYQICWVDPTDPANTIEALSALVTSWGAQVHLETDYPNFGIVAVSAWLTRDQFNDDLTPNLSLKATLNPLNITPDSGSLEETMEPGLPLSRLFNPYHINPDASYFFPAHFVPEEFDNNAPSPVRVYIIDRGLAANEPQITNQFLTPPNGARPICYKGEDNICVNAIIHDKEDGENISDTSSDHPRQVVNMIAGGNNGSAAGTAMNLIGVDIYTGVEDDPQQTYASYLLEGILSSLKDYQASQDYDFPALIVIASSGEDLPQNDILDNAIQDALDIGVPIILSAGNEGSNVSNYLPARLGHMPGVITVGASNPVIPKNPAQASLEALNPISNMSNRDPENLDGDPIVTLFAPGMGIDTGFGSEDGTSFSCGLVAGLAATFLAQNPIATPEQLEEALIDMSASYNSKTEGNINLARSTCTYLTWLAQNGLAQNNPPSFEADFDNDGFSDFMEFLSGSDPTNEESFRQISQRFDPINVPTGLTIRLGPSLSLGENSIHDGCFNFQMALMVSNDLVSWENANPPAEPVRGSLVDGLREWSFNFDLQNDLHEPDNQCFYRIDFIPPPSP